ncbi:MAG: TonB-dependent receptor [Chthoniobacterales bacterium]|nr:TonB-dependent receptor [Chthoniobacterales bacterium]
MPNPFELQGNKKAFQINMDPSIYGTFAEIGAGQEVARRFFHVGGASGTVAKTMSAYDMAFSDAIYGRCGRYVSRERLNTMLDHEYQLLIQRLNEKSGSWRTFFAFADTVAARSYKSNKESHGWMGIRFQTAPLGEPHEIILHVRLLDAENIDQQEVLGIVGINLIYGAFFLRKDPTAFIASLIDDLTPLRVEIDMIRFAGPDFKMVDNRIMCLELVTQGLAQAVLFNADGDVIQAADKFHNKPLLVERGSFRPVTLLANDMLDCSLKMFLKNEQLAGQQPEILMEITMSNLLREGALDHQDFMDRIDMLSALGRTVLISNYGEFYRLIQYLTRYTTKNIGLPLGIPSLYEIFDEKYYTKLEGGILEGLGRLFKKGVQLYVYPTLDEQGNLLEANSFPIQPHLKDLYEYLLSNNFIISVNSCHPDYLGIQSLTVINKIKNRDESWKKMVPPEVAELIGKRKLFGVAASL